MLNDEQSWVPHYVIPGNPGASLLWQRVNGIGGYMPPPPSAPLTQNEIDTIANWIANFDQTTVTVLAQPSNGGTVTGGGTFTIGSSRTISASANSGWTFVQWNDGNTAAVRTIIVPSCDVTYTAFFQSQGPPTAAFFMGEIPLGNGVYYLQFNGTPFGLYVYLSDRRWIYHFDMGYEYWFDANDGQRGIFFYDFTSGHFFYTSPTFGFPYLYDFNLHTVLYYYPDPAHPAHYTRNPRYFYNFATHQIITM
jgi:hypothetical protein